MKLLAVVATVIVTRVLRPKGIWTSPGPPASSNVGGDGTAVVPGKPEASRRFEVISGEKPTTPKSADRLSPEQVEAIRLGIAEGAPWPGGEILAVAPKDWWSLRPLIRPDVPQHEGDRARTPIDGFMLGGLRAKRLKPSPEAGRRTLIRRASFDLIGLPPEPEEVDAFLSDRPPTPTSGSSTACSRASDTASAGGGTGSTSPATATRTATTRISLAPTPGPIAIA